MKKLIVLSVVLALAVGTAFAVDLGANVVGTFNVVTGDSGKDAAGDANPLGASGTLNKLQLQGAGEAGDGNFGAWIRASGSSGSLNGFAWWKPIDQLKITLGGNPDGMFDKNGVAGWSFGQIIYDTGVVLTQDNIWGGSNIYGGHLKYRNALYRGFGGDGLIMEINPVDMLGINLVVPFAAAGTKAEDVYRKLIGQVNLNFDFGNIALTYEGDDNYLSYSESWDGKAGDNFYAFFGLSAIENLNLDLGVGLQFNNDDGYKNPFYVAFGVKYVAGAFGIKLRGALLLPSEDDQSLEVLAELLPYYAISDSVKAFFAAGLGLTAPSKNALDIDSGAESVVGFHINPYLEIGNEWGPAFYIGLQIWSDGKKTPAGDDPVVKWAVPIGVNVSF